MNINVTMTAEEHYALTALLRSGVTLRGLEMLGLEGLTHRLMQPYKDELIERGLDALAALQPLPALMHIQGGAVHTEVPLAHQHEGEVYSACRPLEWYRWPAALLPLAEVQP